LANRLRNLAEESALSFATSEIGATRDARDHVRVRPLRENGNRGTDHGHANVMFVLGGKVRGGKVYGSGPA
jgi:uncharacterized protein (DUF1501 family)